MVTVVVSLNVVLAIVCLGAVWRLNQVRCDLRRLAQQLIMVEPRIAQMLHRAPSTLRRGQAGIKLSRKQMAKIEALGQQVGRLSVLLSALKWVYERQRLARGRLVIGRQKLP